MSDYYRIASTSGNKETFEAIKNGEDIPVRFCITGDFDYFPSCYAPMQIDVRLNEVDYEGDSEKNFKFVGVEPAKDREFSGAFDFESKKGYIKFE